MKSLITATLFIFGWSCAVQAQDAPKFFQDTYPNYALEAALQARGALEGEGAELDPKSRELIALGVAAQIPCSYCVYSHTTKARALGATDSEVREAVATAAQVRHWSTVLNGMAYDLEAFKSEYDDLVESTN